MSTEQEKQEQIQEILRCADLGRSGVEGCIHFIRTHCYIEDPQRQGEKWFLFELWPEQEDVVRKLFENQKTIAMKARQLGLTWLAIAVGLWFMTFRPGSKVGLFSARDKEAVSLLKDRMKGMHKRLPDHIRPAIGEVNNDHEWLLANSSVAFAFPTGRGDSYTLTLAIIDEADLPDNLDKTLLAVEPTIDAGGKLFLLSKSIKAKPASTFKRIYRGGRKGENGWCPIFLPWWVRPERTQEWYEEKVRAAIANTGALDSVHENYPATEEEALAPASLDKRIAAKWLERCHAEIPEIAQSELLAFVARRNEGKVEGDEDHLPFSVNGLTVYKLPEEGHAYVIGADPAEGNPTSDPSALTVLDRDSWEEVACFAPRLEPEQFGIAIDQIGRLYNDASAMVERNNHGHAVILYLRRESRLYLFRADDKKVGWITTEKSKNLMYDAMVKALIEVDILIHSLETYLELSSIESNTLRAPEGEHDDRATSICLALQGAKRPSRDLI